MNSVNNNPHKLRVMPVTSPILLNNRTCPYCGKHIDSTEATKEHVIGRRFVPRGKFNGYWNLILWACQSCNNKKSELEDDISAITMQPDSSGRYAENDETLALESVRKVRNCISRRTGKPVKDSAEEIKIRVPLGPNIEMTFTGITPPQIERDRMIELARLHLMGFFYHITYDYAKRTGGFWPGYYMPFHESVRSDWGNPVHLAFMSAVANWEPRVIAIGADGFFKLIIRRHPSDECWSWALEWNRKLRLIGFFGAKEPAEIVVQTFPSLDQHKVPQGPNETTGFRMEIPLADEDDKLFCIEIDARSAIGTEP